MALVPQNQDPGAATILPVGESNAIGQMLGLLGDEWNLLIVRDALMGTSRYAQFLSRLPISSYVLTQRLRVLVRNGLLIRQQHPAVRSRTEYLLTPRSRSLWSVMLSMWAWERDWVTEHRDAMPEMSHKACGQRFTPLLRCRSCGEVASDSDVSLRQGPSGAWGRCAPAASTRRRSEQDAGLYPETMSVFGNRWAAALLLASFLGTKRFTDFQTQLGAPPGSLAERLQTFCRIGVFVASPTGSVVDEGQPRAEYLLTAKGRAFFPVLTGVLVWAQRWYHAPEGPAIVLTHDACGAQFVGELACDQCLAPAESGVIWRYPN